MGSTLAQNQSLSQLFYPNITLSYKNYKAASLALEGAQTNYGLSRSHIGGFMPLRSEVQVGVGFRKKLDLKAVHTVLGVNFSQNNSTFSNNLNSQNYKTVALSVLQFQASVREKLWLYGGGVGFTEAEESFFSPRPFFWGGAARMRALGLNRQILYGSALVYNQKFKLVPVFGANLKLNKHWRVAGILPFQASISRKFTEWFNMELNGALAGYSGGFLQDISLEKVSRKENLKQINVGLAANVHIAKAFNLSLEGGLSSGRSLAVFNAENKKISDLQPGATPYFGASVRYITSKSNFSSKFLNKVGIGL